MGTHRLDTQIEVHAAAEQVWRVLTDFAAYPQWNPFVRSIAGVAQRGERLRILVQPSGGRAMRFTPLVLAAEPAREFRWRGRLLLPGLFDGEHYFLIEALSERSVRFRHGESFSGVLVRPLRASLDRDVRRGFEEMNRALKARAEGREREAAPT